MPPRRPARAVEAWLWTGPLGHLLGGTLDVCAALMRHALLARLRRRRGRS
jgi:hypothetical protein